MKRKMLALLLSAAMLLSLLGATALAVEGDEPATSSASVSEPEEGETTEPDPAEDAGPEESAPPQEGEPPASEDGGEEASSSEPLDRPTVTVGALTAEDVPQDGTAPETEPDAYIPDPAGTITFDNLGRRMRENNLNVLALEENIQAIQAI